ncbi:MAG: hypothetical protein AAGG48_23895 [Planctomycetota bacterium]
MSPEQKTQIDFSKYRSEELITTIAATISLPGAIRSIIRWSIAGVALLVLLVGVVLKLIGGLSLLWWFVLESYAAPAGSLVGLLLGLAEFVRRSLSNMTTLVDLLLETTMQVAIDARELSSGDTEMPPTRDLVEDVYEQVFLVIIREVLGTMFGFFAKPVYWLYHVTLNQMVRLAIRFIPRSEEESTELSPEFLAKASEIGETLDEQGRVVASLKWAKEKFDSLGGWLKLLVMIPCYSIVLSVIVLILLPPLLTWWLFLSP